MTGPVPLALIQIILLGVAAAISPLPVIIALAVQETKRPVVNSIAYLAGGALVYVILTILGAIFLASLEQGTYFTQHGHPSQTMCVFLSVLGLILLCLAYIASKSKRVVKIPGRVDNSLASLGPRGSFAVGVALCRPGWKNITLLIAAFGVCGGNDLNTRQTTVALLIFVTLALSLAALPVIALLILPTAYADQLRVEARAWTERHALRIISIVAAIMGLALLARGIEGLIS